MIQASYLIHGVLPALSAACCFALMASCIKLSSVSLHSAELVFLRSIVGLCLIMPLIIYKGRAFIKTSKLKLHFLRSLISLLALNCFFYALGHVGLAETTLLNSSSPLFIGVMAALVLKEKLDSKALIILVTGFIGLLLILKPATGLFSYAAGLALASGFFIACTKILIRYMSDTEPVLRTVFYFSLLTSLYSSIPMFWIWQTPSTEVLLLMTIAGLLATLGQLLLTYAFTHNNAVSVAPYSYMIVPLASMIGWAGWQEVPDILSIIGGLLVISACIFMSLQKAEPNPWKKKPAA